MNYSPQIVPLEVYEEESAQRQSPPVPLETFSASTLAGKPKPQRQFLDERELIPMSNVTTIYGDGGTGKSLLALQLSAAVAAGAPWLSATVRRGKVLYLSAEDDEDEIHIRLDDICRAEGIDFYAMHDLHIAVMAGKDAVLGAESIKAANLEPTRLFRSFEAKLDEIDPLLVVLDNQADVYAGDENKKTLARQFIGLLRGVAIRRKCALVMLAHPSLSGMSSGTGTSGNTAWNNSVRSRLYLQRIQEKDGDKTIEPDPDERLLATKKMNYGRIGGEIRLRWEAGRFRCTDAPTLDGTAMAASAAKAERVFMHLMRWHRDKEINVSPLQSPSYAPAVFARHPQSEGVTRRMLERAMAVLLEANKVKATTTGPPSKRRHALTIVERYGDEE